MVSLAQMVRTKYNSARAAGSLDFAESQLAEVLVAGVSYQLRYCPSLAKKPTKDKPDNGPKAGKEKTFDPFENPPADLLISDTSEQRPEHILILNKYPIIANHFMLATKANKRQTHQLEAEDIYQTYRCLNTWQDEDDSGDHERRLFGFFNSGDFSGASQPHRHIQFLPVEDIRSRSGSAWRLLVDEVAVAPVMKELAQQDLRCIPTLPFVHLGIAVPKDCTRPNLFAIYKTLYMAAAASARHFRSKSGDVLEYHFTADGDLPISYNLGMTKDVMVICPRRSEGRIVQRKDGTDVDFVGLNGTLLGGTLMVKNEELFDLLQIDTTKIADVLAATGIPPGQVYGDFRAKDLDPDNYPESGLGRQQSL